MINNVIMQLRISLEENKQELYEIEIKIKRLIAEMQLTLTPFYKSFEEIKAEEIEQCADELLKAKKEAVQIQSRISDIKNQLGE